MAVEFVPMKSKRKIVTDSSDDVDDDDGNEYNCVSAKRQKLTMDNSQGTIDDNDDWNVSYIPSYLTTTTPMKSAKLTIANTSFVHYTNVDDDDWHIQNENAEKTLCDLDVHRNAHYGKIKNKTKTNEKKIHIYSDDADNLLCH